MRKQAAVGEHIRNQVIPPGMSVKEAAKRLDVSRPALSNLLNGKAALSPKMATRMQKAFGADQDELLRLQANQDRERTRDEEKAVAVRGYVPSFVTIKAQQISLWADNINARSQLPVLLRKLVHGTGRDLRRVDFPGFDNSERPGWDGWVEADAATAWIPQGASRWEFGTSQRPQQKAESDYAKRLQLPIAEREQCAFIFVTPRNWPGKDDWAKGKGAGDDGWREVRAYDASDLEQWLEEAIATPVWLAEQLLPAPIPGVRTLEACWAEWAGASKPPMTEHLFQPSVEACVGSFKQWLAKAPEHPFVVAADSETEALAFLRCLFRHDDIQGKYGDQAAVFDSPDTLTALAVSSAPFIPIAANAETQERLPAFQHTHCIALCPRNTASVKPDFALKLLGGRAFAEGLKGMGFDRHDVDRLARESGRSPTVLRRRLATVPAIRTPQWAGDARLAGWLMPMCLVGAWHSHSKADQRVLADLADCGYEDVEKQIARLRQLGDSPVWSVGQYRGVTSKVDALFAIAALVTEANILRFLSIAEAVLSEPDPALDLPETARWLASVHGKVRRHSGALRDGILETLVLLAVHGNHLYQERLGLNVEAVVSDLVGRLLTPLAERLLSQERDLPSYAEAAPQKMLQILEDDLKSETPVVLQLLKPTGSPPFEHCSRTGLLWAIECMAWNPEHLSRACTLLARLSQVEIGDRWANKPIESLAGILRSWMPQTAASLDERIEMLSALNQRFPEIGWQLCLGEIETLRIAMDNYRPRWRSDAEGAGGVATINDAVGFIRHAVSLLLSRSCYDQCSLGDLVENMDALPEARRSEVWERIEAWATGAEEDAVAELRERIRACSLVRVGRRIDDDEAVERARLTYERIRPSTPNVRHAWLFASAWIRESAGDEPEVIDVEEQERRIDALRRAAMEEIWTEQGLDGVLTMIESGGHPWTLGRYAAVCAKDAATVLRACLASDLETSKVDAFMGAFIFGCAQPAESDLLLDFAKQIDAEQAVRLMACAPFQKATWRVLDRLPSEVKVGYWRTASPRNWRLDDTELGEAAEELLAAGRPRAAFHAVRFASQRVEPALLKRLLAAVAFGGSELDAEFSSLDSWRVSEALDVLGATPDITVQDMARLEYAFLDVLRGSEHGIPNIERLIEDSPAFFVDILVYCFKRDDRGPDSVERQVEGEEHRRALAKIGYELLHRIARIPGTRDGGAVAGDVLLHWVKETRRLCAEVGRASIGDVRIGQLLANAPEDADGVWPHRAVCGALQEVANEDVSRGFSIGKRNLRGAFVRVGYGGDMERDLAAEYRRWAQQRRVEYPFAGRVLEAMARFYDQDAEREDQRATLSKRLNTWA